jgi:hypothetical protein
MKVRPTWLFVLALGPAAVPAQPGGLVPAPDASVPTPRKDLNMGASGQQILQQDADPECQSMLRQLDEMGFMPQRRSALWERYQAECQRGPAPDQPAFPR